MKKKNRTRLVNEHHSAARFSLAAHKPTTIQLHSPPICHNNGRNLTTTSADKSVIVPPVAPKEPKETVVHGETLTDNYYWMRHIKEDPRVMEYINKENEYTDSLMKPTEKLQAKLYQEMLGRIQETDQSLPYFVRTKKALDAKTENEKEKGEKKEEGYFYYYRTVEGEQYRIYCRKKAGKEEGTGKVVTVGEEEILIDLNDYARQHGLEFADLGVYETSPDNNILAYSVDTDGGERFELHFKDLRTGQIFEEKMHDTYYSLEWSNDSKSVYYTILDTSQRPFRVLKHTLGTSSSDDVIIFEEKDESYHTSLSRSNDDRFMFIELNSQVTSEVYFVDLDDPQATPRMVQPREHKVEYSVEHHGDHFWIITNDNAINFKLVTAPVSNPGKENWKEIIPHREQVKLDHLQVFKNFFVLQERENGLKHFRVMPADNLEGYHHIQMPEPVYSVSMTDNVEFDTETLRFSYISLTTPLSVYDYDMRQRTSVLMKEQKVLGGYDKNLYKTERIFAKSVIEGDDTLIPISLVYRKDLVERDSGKTSPLLLYGYGAYGMSKDVDFSSNRLSLLDRGFVYAIGHIRGGGDMGRPWYESGKLLKKKNTFYDMISCAQHLVDERYTSPKQLAIRGGSAGGLLVTASMTMAPQLFNTVIALVPFVDCINTMLDESIPLTVIEFEEWGNPKIKEFFDYMKSYSPYDNIRKTTYPNVLLTTGLSDPRVQYWEPLKFTAKLRELREENGNVVLLKTKTGSGHMGEAGRYKYLQEVAFENAFLLHRVLGDSVL